MNRFRFNLFPSVVLATFLALGTACRDSAHSHHDRPGDDHHGHGHGHGHSHDALHGGQVIVLGEEAFHLELVRDRAAGRLTLYALDGHMENFVRLSSPTIPISLTADGAQHTLELAAVAQSATGETVGDTSQFSAPADWLRNARNISGRIAAIEIRGQTFTDIAFDLAGDPPVN
jgi:hypothetical protein